ncbi:CSEP0026 putative effector protein [Blumeria hordei DH14]|uniref:CSEP0026 putative effector protein n=1 Tax=Blumeria graminis f. sp. hordei (strain DH14) TaxID=546991 RepID=N1JE11_BLUG1|nr:CSEP0026 putative effector protein [Blumeria hordei DH14]
METITAPLAAFCMATILFAYTRTSIDTAKRDAQRHRIRDQKLQKEHYGNRFDQDKIEYMAEARTVAQPQGTQEPAVQTSCGVEERKT